MKNKKQLAIEELKGLRKKIHLYTEDNRDLVEKRIKELTSKHNITYGDLWETK